MSQFARTLMQSAFDAGGRFCAGPNRKKQVMGKGVAQISVVTTLECEEPVAALIERIFGGVPSIYTNVEKGHSIVTLYARTTVRALKGGDAELNAGFAELRALG